MDHTLTPVSFRSWLAVNKAQKRTTGTRMRFTASSHKSTALRALPLSWEIPKPVFSRPPNFFPRPERFFEGDTFKDFILREGEAVREYPWEFAILFSIIALVFVQVFFKFSNGRENNNLDTQDEEIEETDDEEEEEEEYQPRNFTTNEERALYAMRRMEFQSEQNRSLLLLGLTTALSLWLAGFLNTPHPFEP